MLGGGPLGEREMKVHPELLEVGWDRVVLAIQPLELLAETGEQRMHVRGARGGPEEADHDGPAGRT